MSNLPESHPEPLTKVDDRLCLTCGSRARFHPDGVCPRRSSSSTAEVEPPTAIEKARAWTNPTMPDTERALRREWWLSHTCRNRTVSSLYGDDGEMQAKCCLIDFLRFTPNEISARLANHRASSEGGAAPTQNDVESEWAAGAKVHICGLGHIEGHVSEEAKAEIHQYAYHLRDHRDEKVEGCRFCEAAPGNAPVSSVTSDPDRIVAGDFCGCGVFLPDVTDGISFHRPDCERLRRKIVVVVGSMRYHRAMQEYALASMAKHDDLLMLIPEKWELEHAGSPMPGVIHRRKIQIADSVLVFNAYGYIGEDTAAEIGAARLGGKPLHYYEPAGGSDCEL